MRVLVTGHRGYIGCSLVAQLLAAGFEVKGCDSDLYHGCDFGGAPPGIDELGRDIRELDAGSLCGFDAIIHLAGLSNDPLGELDPALTEQINHRATIQLARSAREADVARFLFSSSCSSYGAAGEGFIDEGARLNPLTAYGRSKVAAEQGLAQLATKQFSPCYLRNATVYGWSPRMRFDLVVNNLSAWAFTSGRVLLKSQGLAWRPLVHVDDVASAFLAVLLTPRERWHNRAYNIGLTGENYQVRDVARMVAEQQAGAELAMVEGAPADARDYRVNCDLFAREIPAWKPRWQVAAGIEQLLEAYRAFDLQAGDFEGPRFQRLAHLQARLASGSLDGALRPAQDSPAC